MEGSREATGGAGLAGSLQDHAPGHLEDPPVFFRTDDHRQQQRQKGHGDLDAEIDPPVPPVDLEHGCELLGGLLLKLFLMCIRLHLGEHGNLKDNHQQGNAADHQGGGTEPTTGPLGTC